MNLPAQSIHFDPTGTPASRRLATLSILSTSITRTAFSMILPSAGLITVPPTSESFSACAASASNSSATKAVNGTESFTIGRLLDRGRVDKANNCLSRHQLWWDRETSRLVEVANFQHYGAFAI